MSAVVPGPARLRRALIAQALRRYRESLGLTVREAAAVMDRHASALSRIETGVRGIRPRELGALLADYAVPTAERAVLLRLAQPGPARWLGADARVLPPDLAEYLTVEQAATELLVWAPSLVPDLLQTADYTRAVLAADPSCEHADAAVRTTTARQAAIHANTAAVLDVVIGEATLRQAVGSPEVMTGQARALTATAEASGPDALRVLPFTAGAHALAGYGPFTLLRFSGAPALSVVHLSGPGGGTCLTSPDTAGRYRRAFQLAKAAALGPDRSTAFLQHLAGGAGR